MNQAASKVSGVIIRVALAGIALLCATANAGDPVAAGAPATGAQEPPAEEGSGAWEKTKEVSHDAWQATKEGSAKAWDKTKEVSSGAWEATKEGSAKAWDKTKEVTHETMEKISPSEPTGTPDHDREGTAPASPEETR